MYQIAREEGLEEGLTEGRTIGLNEGRAVGLAEGRSVGLAEGRMEGRMEGRAVEARRLLQTLGASRLGAPPDDAMKAIDSLSDIDELERLLAGLFTATSWQELLAPPPEH